ncbi:MAG: DNA internalization-related competence protein ComEC/Rec2, partial [Burkholderiales bacterium]|nr:DNA internalization-related competence protein ComEC/Rec2 [Burkholderiales bacterium]
TGINHLMSLSGLHITLWSALVYAAVLRGWRRVPGLARRVPAQVAAALTGLAASTAYALLAGFAVPAQRTVVMLAVVAITLALRLAVPPARVLATAAVAVIVFDPFAVVAPGFWLSFGAVAWLMAAASAAPDARAPWRGWLRTQAVLFAGLAPFTLAFFQQISLVAPIANAFAVPLVSFVVVPLSLAALCVPWGALAQAAAAAMDVVSVPLDALAAFDGALWTQADPPGWSIALALVGIAWALAPRGVPHRAVGMLLCVPMLAPVPVPIAAGTARLTLLDVGQGLAAVIRTRHAALIFDAGPAWSAEADAGARVVVPWLRAEGVGMLSMLIASHDDNDHTGGVRAVLDAVPATTVVTSVPRDVTAEWRAPRVLRCAAGAHWSWDGVRFDILSPTADSYTGLPRKDNAMSCVLKVRAGDDAVLLAADAEADGSARSSRPAPTCVPIS